MSLLRICYFTYFHCLSYVFLLRCAACVAACVAAQCRSAVTAVHLPTDNRKQLLLPVPVQPAVAERKAAQRSAAQSCCSSPDSESSTHIHTHTCTQCAVSLCRCWRRSQRWPCVLKCALGFLRTKNWSTAPNTHTHTHRNRHAHEDRRQGQQGLKARALDTHIHTVTNRETHTHLHSHDCHCLPLLTTSATSCRRCFCFTQLSRSLFLSLALKHTHSLCAWRCQTARCWLKVYWMNEWVSTKRAELSRDLSWVL